MLVVNYALEWFSKFSAEAEIPCNLTAMSQNKFPYVVTD